MERAREHGSERPGVACVACAGYIDELAPGARCPLCARERHVGCIAPDRRCDCGALLTARVVAGADTGAELGRAAIEYARRELWTWLLPLPFVLAAAWVLATSTRVWTDMLLVVSKRGGMTEMPVGAYFRPRLILGVLAYAALPSIAGWLAGLHAQDAVAEGSPRSRRVAWSTRVLALVYLAWVTTRLLAHR